MSVAPSQPSRPPKPTAIGFHTSEPTSLSQNPQQLPFWLLWLPKGKWPSAKAKVDDSKPANLAVPPHATQSPLEGTSDLLDNLLLEACVELTHQIFVCFPPSYWGSLPVGCAENCCSFCGWIWQRDLGWQDRRQPVPCLLECRWNSWKEV